MGPQARLLEAQAAQCGIGAQLSLGVGRQWITDKGVG